MNSVTSILQDADPIRHEAPPSDARFEAMRRRVTAAVPEAAVTQRHPLMTRRAFAGAVAVAVAAVGYAVVSEQAAPVYAAVELEIRLAEDAPAPGLIVANTGDADRLLYLHPDVIISNADVAQTFVAADMGTASLLASSC
jgi:hypothetical protein